MTEETQGRRAALAHAMVQACGQRFPDGEPLQAIVASHLADLMHYCDLKGLPFDELLGAARIHYANEQ